MSEWIYWRAKHIKHVTHHQLFSGDTTFLFAWAAIRCDQIITTKCQTLLSNLTSIIVRFRLFLFFRLRRNSMFANKQKAFQDVLKLLHYARSRDSGLPATKKKTHENVVNVNIYGGVNEGVRMQACMHSRTFYSPKRAGVKNWNEWHVWLFAIAREHHRPTKKIRTQSNFTRCFQRKQNPGFAIISITFESTVQSTNKLTQSRDQAENFTFDFTWIIVLDTLARHKSVQKFVRPLDSDSAWEIQEFANLRNTMSQCAATLT